MLCEEHSAWNKLTDMKFYNAFLMNHDITHPKFNGSPLKSYKKTQ